MPGKGLYDTYLASKEHVICCFGGPGSGARRKVCDDEVCSTVSASISSRSIETLEKLREKYWCEFPGNASTRTGNGKPMLKTNTNARNASLE